MGGRGGKVDYRRGRGRRKGRPEVKKAGALVRPLLKEVEKIGGERKESEVLAEVESTLFRVKKLQGAASSTWDLYCAVRDAGLPLSQKAYGTIISTIGGAKGWDALKRARSVFDDMRSADIDMDQHIVSAMIAACAKAGDDELAFEVWEEAETKRRVEMDTTILNTLLHVCAETRQADRAAEMYAVAREHGVQPDEFTLGTLLNAMAKEGRAEQAMEIYREGTGELQISTNKFIVSAMITAFARVGDPLRGLEIFEEGKEAGVVVDEMMINSLINAFGRLGDADQAKKLFDEGCAAGLELATNEVTIASMLCAFSRARQVAPAIEFFNQVAPLWPNGKPPPVCYLLLRDVAAQAGDEVAALKISEMMRSMRSTRDNGTANSQPNGQEQGVEDPDSAPPEKLRRGVYPFATFTCRDKIYRTENGDTEKHLPPSHEEHQLLAGAAHDLVSTLRENTDYNFHHSCVMLMRGGDAAKEEVLTTHAEKKALGALIRAGEDGQLMKVSVNIRMCRDCHEAFKHASSHFRREIVCDDRSNVHVFKAGICSCGECWR